MLLFRLSSLCGSALRLWLGFSGKMICGLEALGHSLGGEAVRFTGGGLRPGSLSSLSV